MLYRCPEMAKDKRIFSYAAKAHPALAAGEELIVSYVVCSFDFEYMTANAGIYWPRPHRFRPALFWSRPSSQARLLCKLRRCSWR